MKSFLQEFKSFALRGNVIDLAVGVIIGTAFGKIVSSAVTDVIMPPIGILINSVNFSELYWNLSKVDYPTLEAATKAGAPTINYGIFLTNIIGFAITAFVIFIFIKQINRFKPTKEEKKKEKDAKNSETILAEIRDLLRDIKEAKK